MSFLYDPQPSLVVAVKGRVERIVGAASLSMEPLKAQNTGALGFRVEAIEEVGEILRSLVEEAVAAAWKAGAARAALGQTVEENSPQVAVFEKLGFTTEGVHEVYETPTARLRKRIGPLYERMRAHGVIPAGAEIATLQPALIAEVRRFILQHMPGSASLLAIESAGYKPEHSLALLLAGEVKGVLLWRRSGNIGITGLRLVAPELRGGLPWANTMMLAESLRSEILTGVEKSRFELNPEVHHDTKLLAQSLGASLLGRRLLFGLKKAGQHPTPS